jgi:diguanylate cyclase (GGDEF)-like protein
MAHSKRTGDMLAVLYLDLDGFKQINDSLGHQAGNAALVHAAKALQASVRESDTVCRLGSDEFVIFAILLAHGVHAQAGWWQGLECMTTHYDMRNDCND